jgi:hypothetical protein
MHFHTLFYIRFVCFKITKWWTKPTLWYRIFYVQCLLLCCQCCLQRRLMHLEPRLFVSDPRSRIIVLARAFSNLLDRTGTYGATNLTPTQKDRIFPSLKTRTLPEEKKDLGHRSRRDLKPRLTVLVRTSSNLTDRPHQGCSNCTNRMVIV